MLHGSRVALVPWRAEHAPPLAALANDVEVARYLTPLFPHPYRPSDAHAWIARQPAAGPHEHFAIEASGVLVGGIGVVRYPDGRRDSAFVGYYLGRAFWGRGYASEAVRLATAFGFTLPGITRMWANVMGPNVASMRVLEKNGYLREAVFPGAIVDRWCAKHDEHIFARGPIARSSVRDRSSADRADDGMEER
jgi:RimJ/RimL family protein N-acetyltransferase